MDKIVEKDDNEKQNEPEFSLFKQHIQLDVYEKKQLKFLLDSIDWVHGNLTISEIKKLI